MEQNQPSVKPAIRRWRYWIIYRWTVIGLWIVQMSLHLPYLVPYRGVEFGGPRSRSLPGTPSYTGPVSYVPQVTGFDSDQILAVILFLSGTAGLVLIISLIFAFPWALTIWLVGKIGGTTSKT